MMKLYDYQRKLVDDPSNRVAYYLEMGLGKTLVASTKAVSLAVPTIIVCPKAVIGQWINHYLSQHPDWSVFNLTKPKEFTAYQRLEQHNKVGVISYGLVWRRPDVLKFKDYTLILDESHNICNPTSKQTKGIMKLKFENLILLSGTPNSGRYDKLYTQMKLLGYKENKRTFEDRYCNFFEMESGGVKFRVLSKTNPYKNIPELKNVLTNLNCHFMKTTEVLELPSQHFVKCDVEQSKLYKQYCKDGYVETKDKEYVADTPTVDLLNRRLLSNVNKYDFVQTLLDGIEDRVIIFYNFNEELDQLLQVVKHRNHCIINGSHHDLRAFEKYDDCILLAQTTAGATGLNLQYCNKIIYFSLPLSSNLYEQSKARTWRNGQKEKCTYWLLLCGIDYDILKSLNNKQDYTLKLFKKG